MHTLLIIKHLVPQNLHLFNIYNIIQKMLGDKSAQTCRLYKKYCLLTSFFFHFMVQCFTFAVQKKLRL